MSRNAVERALWQLSVDRGAKEKYRADAEKFLERFALSAEECRQILEYDVKTMQANGVNPMLTMGFWQELGPKGGMKSYIKTLRGTEVTGQVHSAALKGSE